MTVPPPPDGESSPQVPPPPDPPPSRLQASAVTIRTILQGILLTVPISFVLILILENLHLPLPGIGMVLGTLLVIGGALCFVRLPQFRGLIIGLVTGWAVLSIVSGGFCTGFAKFGI